MNLVDNNNKKGEKNKNNIHKHTHLIRLEHGYRIGKERKNKRGRPSHGIVEND